jgi:hypothetical protein
MKRIYLYIMAGMLAAVCFEISMLGFSRLIELWSSLFAGLFIGMFLVKLPQIIAFYKTPKSV